MQAITGPDRLTMQRGWTLLQQATMDQVGRQVIEEYNDGHYSIVYCSRCSRMAT